MTIDWFYKITHVLSTVLVVGLFINVWIRYAKIEHEESAAKTKNSYSIFFFILAMVLWEYNLFDLDYKYEIFTTIIVDSLLLVAATYFNDGTLVYNSNGRHKYLSVKIIPSITIIFIAICNVLVNMYRDNYFIGYFIPLVYTFVTFIILSIRLVIYFNNKRLLEIGIAACLLFLCLYVSIVASIFYSSNEALFAWAKICYLVSTFGLYLVFSNLAFTFYQEVVNKKYTKIFVSDTSGTQIEHMPLDKGRDFFYKLINEDKIEEVVKILLEEKDSSNDINAVLLLGNRITNLNMEKVRGIVTDEQFRSERNKIVNGLIEIVNKAKR